MNGWLIAGYAASLCAGAGWAWLGERASLRNAIAAFEAAAASYQRARKRADEAYERHNA